MKKRILALLFSVFFMFSMAPLSAFAQITTETTPATTDVAVPKSQGEMLYDRYLYVVDMIRDYGIYSSDEDDPLKNYLIDLFNENPDEYVELMNNMLLSHDSHSGYFTTDEHTTAYQSNGSYVGIGITINATSEGFRIELIGSAGNNASKMLKIGDIITAVDGVSANGLSLEQLVSRIRGEAGTYVTLTILRDGVTQNYSIQRVQITVSNISYSEIEDYIYYMNIASFGNTMVYNDFLRAYNTIIKDNCKVLVLDLRNNPGGEIDTALNIENTMISTAGLDFAKFESRVALGGDIISTSSGLGAPLNKIIVLVNENSASASEFVAAGLRITEDAVIVGTETYGKSTGQYHITVDQNDVLVLSMLRISVPGESDYIDIGITPDYYVENATETHNDTDFLPLDTTTELYMSNYSDKTQALNERLAFLGYLSKGERAYKTFDSDTLKALNQFQTANGIAHTNYANTATLIAIDKAVKTYDGVLISSVDSQYEKALELAREAVKQPIQYSVSWDGTIQRISTVGKNNQ